MGYFSNGTEGLDYREQYCSKCLHWQPLPDEGEETAGCPVMDVHLVYNYGQTEQVKAILNMLIPPKENGFNDQCAMFVAKVRV